MSTMQRGRANPYVGPRHFEDGETLYGRDQETLALSHLLIAERIVLLYSPSGAGKTSLLRAALIPKLREFDFHVLPVIRVGAEPPQPDDRLPGEPPNRYLLSMLLSLDEHLPQAQQTPVAELAALDLSAYLDRWREVASNKAESVLIFDQFEEILTVDPTDQAEKASFFAQLGAALRDRERWALFAMREEFRAGLDSYRNALPTRLSTTYRLEFLNPEAARLAIQRPAQDEAVDFADAAAKRLIDDLRQVRVMRPDGTAEVKPGAFVEPVQLQVVCRRLWERLPAGATRITPENVALAGNVDTALGDYYAERVAAVAGQTGSSERAIRQWFDQHLITQQGIRTQVLQEPEASQGLSNRAISRLVDAHLVRAEQRRGATWFELAHDRLVEPVRSDNVAWREAHLSVMQRQASLWESQGRPDGLLTLRDQALEEAERWLEDHADEATDVERAFVDECCELVERAALEEQARSAKRLRRFRRLAVLQPLSFACSFGFLLASAVAGSDVSIALILLSVCWFGLGMLFAAWAIISTVWVSAAERLERRRRR